MKIRWRKTCKDISWSNLVVEIDIAVGGMMDSCRYVRRLHLINI